jgi:hypothetical protein
MDAGIPVSRVLHLYFLTPEANEVFELASLYLLLLVKYF